MWKIYGVKPTGDSIPMRSMKYIICVFFFQYEIKKAANKLVAEVITVTRKILD